MIKHVPKKQNTVIFIEVNFKNFTLTGNINISFNTYRFDTDLSKRPFSRPHSASTLLSSVLPFLSFSFPLPQKYRPNIRDTVNLFCT